MNARYRETINNGASTPVDEQFSYLYDYAGRRLLKRARDAEKGIIRPYEAAFLPWSYAAKIGNSLILIALSIALFVYSSGVQVDQLNWNDFGRLLLLLASLEGFQLLFPSLRRKNLTLFHSCSAILLVSGAILSMTSGLNQAVLLAAQALILGVAGSLSPSLRFLRPLATLPSTLLLRYYITADSFTLIDLIPPVLLFACSVPVGFFSKNPNNVMRSTFGLWLEYITGNWRVFLSAVFVEIVLHRMLANSYSAYVDHLLFSALFMVLY